MLRQDYDIPATVVEEGGGIGWVLHPMGAADAHPCDWNPAAFGQHCEHVNCPHCGAPWYAADGACPCACGKMDQGGISGGHFPELDQVQPCVLQWCAHTWCAPVLRSPIATMLPVCPQDIPYGNSIPNLAKSNTIEDRLQAAALRLSTTFLSFHTS